MPLNILKDEFPESVFVITSYIMLLVNEEIVRNALSKVAFTISECSNME